jgi:hypothetical protein
MNQDAQTVVEVLEPFAALCDSTNPLLQPKDDDDKACFYLRIGDLRRAREALAAARRLLDAPPGVGECETCAKLPKTKDGVPIVPGMRVFVSDVGQEGTVEGITSPIEDKFYTSSIVTDDGAHRRPPAAYVFSTRAAALAPAASSAAEGSVATGEGGQ